MNQYILQLLEDMLMAQRPDNDRIAEYSIDSDENLERHFEDVERYLSGDFQQTIASVIGFDEVQFPPVEKLTGEQMKLVVDGFDKLLFSFNITTDLPDVVPIEIAYKLLVGALQREIYVGDGDGFVTIEFCHYEPADCPYGKEFCRCMAFDKDVDDMNSFKTDDGELPF